MKIIQLTKLQREPHVARGQLQRDAHPLHHLFEISRIDFDGTHRAGILLARAAAEVAQDRDAEGSIGIGLYVCGACLSCRVDVDVDLRHD